MSSLIYNLYCGTSHTFVPISFKHSPVHLHSITECKTCLNLISRYSWRGHVASSHGRYLALLLPWKMSSRIFYHICYRFLYRTNQRSTKETCFASTEIIFAREIFNSRHQVHLHLKYLSRNIFQEISFKEELKGDIKGKMLSVPPKIGRQTV